jgi:hypothetical protein
MFNIILVPGAVGVGAALCYGSDQMMQLRLRNTDFNICYNNIHTVFLKTYIVKLLYIFVYAFYVKKLDLYGIAF